MNGLNKRVYSLDLLRFAAAFVVVLYHYTARPESPFEWLAPFTSFGYLGVPVFFMISGFVIAMSAQGRTAYQFGVSRFARLYPGLWAGMLFTVAVLYLVRGEIPSPQQFVTNALLINDYIGQPNIDGVYWTLHAELKFYACVFLLVATGIFPRYQIWLTAWLMLTILHATTGAPSFMGWFISPSWSPYFIAGVAMYLIGHNGADRFNIAVFATALALAVNQSFNVAGSFIAGASILDKLVASGIVVASALVLLAIATQKIRIQGAVWITTLGAMTYPLYLIHSKAGKAIIDGPFSSLGPELAVMSTIVLMLAFAYIIYRFIERPGGNAVRRFGFSLPGRIKLKPKPAAQKTS